MSKDIKVNKQAEELASLKERLSSHKKDYKVAIDNSLEKDLKSSEEDEESKDSSKYNLEMSHRQLVSPLNSCKRNRVGMFKFNNSIIE